MIKKGLLLRILRKKVLIFKISTQIFLKIRRGLTPPFKIQGGCDPPTPPTLAPLINIMLCLLRGSTAVKHSTKYKKKYFFYIFLFKNLFIFICNKFYDVLNIINYFNLHLTMQYIYHSYHGKQLFYSQKTLISWQNSNIFFKKHSAHIHIIISSYIKTSLYSIFNALKIMLIYIALS